MIITTCPTCKEIVVILEDEINCGIFRHAVYRNGIEVPPHTSKHVMESLLQQELIFGCGSPFQLKKEGDSFTAVESDWV